MFSARSASRRPVRLFLLAGAAMPVAVLVVHGGVAPTLALVAKTGTSPTTISGSGSSAAACGNCSANSDNGSGRAAGTPVVAVKSITITGAVAGLAPGLTRQLVLTVANPNNQDVRVTALSATVASVTKAQNAPSGTCGVSELDLRVGAWTGGSFVVPRNGSASSSPGFIPVTMPGSVGNACQGATFTLLYNGTAVKS